MTVYEMEYDFGWHRAYGSQLGNVRMAVGSRVRFNRRHPIPEKDRAKAVLALRAFWRDRNRNNRRIQRDLRP